ncbi:uncharacterized protein LOC119669452, partial [Teleopsis dalmanni]|uniref:uncharacterized protein LOC119669452 n=1 Tax=Teleopsis dalmanni TaxID=139649 RepID=UPI0018CE31A8
MDLNKQHGFIETNEDRSRAMYYNRGMNMNESRHHRQYFIPERTIGNNKACACSSMPGNIMCNECRTNTTTEDGGWGSQHISRSDIRNIDTKGAIKQNPLYINSSGNNNAYWQQNCSTAVPQMDRNILVKPSTTDTNYSYKQQYQQSDGIPNHQRANSISTYCKERSYNEYTPKSEVKISYMPSATSAASIYNIDNHNNNTGGVLRSGKTDQQVINPSNILSTKEQHPSPNYARKCPQIFSPAEQNSTHMSLYMPTPQFSSDKFINAHNQKLRMESPQHEYRTLNNTTVQKHIMSEKTKLSESPVRLSSPMTGYTNANKSKYPSNELLQPVQSNIMQQQTPYRSNNGQSRNIDYFPQNNPKVHAPEMSPIIAKQSPHAAYQYSNCTVPPPPPTSHILPLRGSTNDLDYVKKEDDLCDSLGVPNRNLYINPYNTPPSSDSCYKESSSPFLSISHYRDESPHSYNKYSKSTQEIDVANKIINVNQNTPPLSRTPSFRNQQYYYETSSKYDGSPYGTPSPAVATVASPSSILSTPQTQTPHHNEYTSPSHRMQSYQSAAIENRRHSNQTQDNVPSHIDAYDLPISQKSKINCPNNIPAIPNQTTGIVQTAQQPKKSHVPKPNYKELINQAYARRNIPEEELNLQIIKKTLNVDTQVIRTNVNNVPRAAAQVDRVQQSSPHLVNVVNNQPNISPAPDTYRNETYRPDLLPHHMQSQARTPVGPIISNIRPPVIKQEEKISNYSPLDLSMRTVKTKADSTEYKYKCYSSSSPSVDCKYGLPRVDFTPNFSMHASDRNVIIKPNGHSRMEQNECVTYTSADLSHIPAMTVPRGEQTPLPKKQYNESNSLIFNNSTQYKANPRSAVIPNEPALTSKANLQRKTGSLVIKSTTNAVVSCDVNICQVRPSVLETNPFATVKSIKSEPKISERNMFAVDKLPPDTSIMPLPKTVVTGPPSNPGIPPIDKKVEPATQSNYHKACELNRNYLGRKRHLHEYSNSNLNYVEPVSKQPRYQEPYSKFENMRSADISVIAVNEKSLENEKSKTAEKSIQAEVTNYPLPPNHIDIPIVNENIVFKEEPVTPTSDVVPIPITPPVPVKTETNFAARIRTKAELKGFTFNPPIENTDSTPPIISVLPTVIKEEPSVPVSNIELPSISGLTEDFSAGSLLDFSWDNTCNNFVKQLLTNKKKPIKKKLINVVKEEISEDDLPVSTIVNKKLSIPTADVQREKDDSMDCLLAENNISNMESATTTNSQIKMDTNESNKTSKSTFHETVSSQSANAKKIGKLERGKMRQQQEKRFAARLPDETSSESDNELDKRKTDRLKKPLKKSKIRNLNTVTEKNRFSDCGSDSTTESDDKIPLSKSIKKSEITEKTENTNCDAKIDESKKTITKSSHEKKELKKCNKEALVECNSSSNKTNQIKKSVNLTKTADKTKISTKVENKLNFSKNVEEDTSTGKNRVEKTNKKKTLQTKVGLNTMTRSKRKRELEMQLANSKVLRNDKIIRNSTTKIKRKYVKKYSSNQKDAINRESSEILSTRLRSRGDKTGNKLKNNILTNNTEKGKNRSETKKMLIAKKRENEEDEILAAYRYKRSLKVPPSLITIKHPQNHKIAASLPDLETHYDDFKSMSNMKSNDDESNLKRETHSEEPRSIIDLLHSRVINKAAVASRIKAKTAKQTSNNGSVKNKNENSQNTETTPLGELLPAIKKEDDESNDGKKRHFSIFETKVLQTKTRTESKLQQRKEIIR